MVKQRTSPNEAIVFNKEFNKRIGIIIKNHRHHLGLRQIDVASKTYMARNTLANIELGRQAASLNQAIRLSRFLHIDFGLFIETSEKMESEDLQ